MKIVSARMTGFRNLADQELEFSPSVNVLVGRNAQGKTNLLEALDYPSLGRSHRGARTEEIIRHDASCLHVSLSVEADDGRVQVFEFGLDRDGGRRFRIDGVPIKRRSDLIGRLATVFFCPQSNELVRGGPGQRRRFADLGISCIDQKYMKSLVSYQRALKQKTRLLKGGVRASSNGANAARELAAWNEELALSAAPLGRGRFEWAAHLQTFARDAHARLASGGKTLDFSYRPRLDSLAAVCGDGRPEAEIHAGILSELDYIGPQEQRCGRPLTGVQFDDFVIRADGLDLRTYGSLGETRTAAISLILAQSEVVFQRRRVRPVLFLDDIFSELDRQRARSLQEMCASDHQVFIATARAGDVAGWSPARLRSWMVEDGRVTLLK